MHRYIHTYIWTGSQLFCGQRVQAGATAKPSVHWLQQSHPSKRIYKAAWLYQGWRVEWFFLWCECIHTYSLHWLTCMLHHRATGHVRLATGPRRTETRIGVDKACEPIATDTDRWFHCWTIFTCVHVTAPVVSPLLLLHSSSLLSILFFSFFLSPFLFSSFYQLTHSELWGKWYSRIYLK